MPIADTVGGCAEILTGDHDDLPESAFYMVGKIDKAVKKATEMRESVWG